MPSERRSLHQPEVVLLADALRRVCQPQPDGTAIYIHPNTDESVAEALRRKIPHLNGRHVARLRQRLIGNLKDEVPHRATQGQQAAITAITERLEALEASRTPGHPGHYLSDLGTRVTRLEARLKRLAEALGERWDD